MNAICSILSKINAQKIIANIATTKINAIGFTCLDLSVCNLVEPHDTQCDKLQFFASSEYGLLHKEQYFKIKPPSAS